MTTTTLNLIILAIAISTISLLEIRRKNKEIENLKKDWQFCKNILDETRGVLTPQQEQQIKEKYDN